MVKTPRKAASVSKIPVRKAVKKPVKRLSPAQRERVAVLFDRFEGLDLHPKTELNYSSP